MSDTPLGIDVKASLAELKDGLKWAASFAGAPMELLRLGRLERAAAKTLEGWLRKLERLADTLLTALAAELGPEAPPEKPPAGLFARLAKGPSAPDFSDEDSRRWRGVRYGRVLGAEPLFPARGGGCKRASAAPSADEADGRLPTASLARRFEALVRIAESPRRFARRLMRQNARRAARVRMRPSRALVARRPAWLKPKLPPPRIRWIDTS